MVIVDVWDRCCTMGRAPLTKEALSDFPEECRVTRHSRIFRGLTGSQRIPGIWGVTEVTISSAIPYISGTNTLTLIHIAF